MNAPVSPGTLYLVPTPIGNLEDVTLRAIRILKEVDLMLCEDTRRTAILCAKYGISTRRDSYQDHNKFRKTPAVLELLKSGKSIALVTEAGTPGISDPGFYLTRAAIETGIKIDSLPGACAAIVALVASGLPTDRFIFEGFLPPKKGRKTRLTELAVEPRTIIFYEAPHRIKQTLADLLTYFGDRRAVYGRELTKIHEEYVRGNLSELVKHVEEKPPRGEYTLVVAGKRD
ncbi:MAG: 16S rRNA (cytidine(1402)-2'-O)-methyltransferase [bacterium]|nr:16S rRNA (cytidine(1402)-2'-O)-methyltransferase [bacterium]